VVRIELVFHLFVAGMVWMHLRHGGHGEHGGHADHGNRHQPSTPAHRHNPGCADHSGHAARPESRTTVDRCSEGHVDHNSTGPKEVV